MRPPGCGWSAQGVDQEIGGALPGECSAGGFEVVTRVAIETVPRGVDVDRRARMVLTMQRDVFGRDDRVALTEVEQHRRTQGLVEERYAAAAVVADRRQAQPSVAEQGERATPAEPHGGRAQPLGLDGARGGGDQVNCAVEAQLRR